VVSRRQSVSFLQTTTTAVVIVTGQMHHRRQAAGTNFILCQIPSLLRDEAPQWLFFLYAAGLEVSTGVQQGRILVVVW